MRKPIPNCVLCLLLLLSLFPGWVAAQTTTVQGTVKDGTGLLLPGVNVVVT